MVFSVALEREDRGNYWFTLEETDRFYRCTNGWTDGIQFRNQKNKVNRYEGGIESQQNLTRCNDNAAIMPHVAS